MFCGKKFEKCSKPNVNYKLIYFSFTTTASLNQEEVGVHKLIQCLLDIKAKIYYIKSNLKFLIHLFFVGFVANEIRAFRLES